MPKGLAAAAALRLRAPKLRAQLQALTTLGLAYNSLDGPLDVISKLPKLVVIFLRNNSFTGIGPVFHPAAQVIDIDNNKLNSLPAGICTGTPLLTRVVSIP